MGLNSDGREIAVMAETEALVSVELVVVKDSLQLAMISNNNLFRLRKCRRYVYLRKIYVV